VRSEPTATDPHPLLAPAPGDVGPQLSLMEAPRALPSSLSRPSHRAGTIRAGYAPRRRRAHVRTSRHLQTEVEACACWWS
jgi:hypothetical protein